ncbi:MAG: Thiol peroxidase, Bcp-type [uncultured Thermoleophilia bacterium]|uniref:thioredoxin-dependent peroxiredoxin n=1 Tax=uncultured Thermoleophilia bacterium TaxID=1497501 RepID=A0A6J4UEW4_9ACTN|nr:MAG: Thiol peroxidase, Bcp-type [uncultured Thermoleophilia bacterium]
MLEPGTPAPDFSLTADSGETVRLADLRGSRVVLYFYPKDDTPGCTTQACDIRDNWDRVNATGARLYGLSPDTVASHVRFREKYHLPFPLLADADHAVAEAYGVWVEKSSYGRRSWGVERSTFLVDEAGRIAQVWRKVKPSEHISNVLAELSASPASA